eukprot:6194534-Pleurochrysis_carterae.AAC.5
MRLRTLHKAKIARGCVALACYYSFCKFGDVFPKRGKCDVLMFVCVFSVALTLDLLIARATKHRCTFGHACIAYWQSAECVSSAVFRWSSKIGIHY